MKHASKLAVTIAAAAAALGVAATDVGATGNTPPRGGDHNPTPGCNGQSDCGTQTGGDTINNYNPNIKNNVDVNNHIKNDVKNNVDVDNNNINKNDNTNVNKNDNKNVNNNNSNATATGGNSSVNIKNPRQVGNAPAVFVSPSGACGSGWGFSVGTIVATGGISKAGQDKKCLDRQTAEFLVGTGYLNKKFDMVVMGLSMFRQVSEAADYAGHQVARVSRLPCGAKMMEHNPVLASEPGVSCDGYSTKGHSRARFVEVAREQVRMPKLVREDKGEACPVKKQEFICVPK